ncbi:MAG: hypothetical protein E7319_08650 [Clostridiales bacterium]|nr:hypothetical protein [Clostridiales bacterium]
MNLKQLVANKTLLWVAVALAALMAALMLGGGTSSMENREEKRIAEVLSCMAGAGKVEVALFYATSGDGGNAALPTGAVVVAEGAEALDVRLSLIRAVRTLLSLPESAVDVFPMEK